VIAAIGYTAFSIDLVVYHTEDRRINTNGKWI
jgi:hypothetical protein